MQRSATGLPVAKDAVIMLDDPATAKAKSQPPLDRVADGAHRVSQMCDLLEALADDLPRRPAPVWREATRMCNKVIHGHYQEILTIILPILKRRTKGKTDCQEVLNRLQADFEDEAVRLSELNDLMTDAIEADGTPIGSEALGYALRCFFGALRRNTSWETDVLLPLAIRHLKSEDLSEIADQLSKDSLEKLH